MPIHFRFSRKNINLLKAFLCELTITVGLFSCYEYHYTYYTADGKSYITRCDYMDSTYFMAGKQTSLRKEMGYVVIQNRDIRGGWKCWLTWANDAAFVLEQYYDFKEKNNPQKLKLARVNDVLLKQIEADRGKRYIMVEYQ